MKLLSFIAILFVLTSCTEKSGFKGSCTQSHIVKKDGFQQEEPKINMESISGYELSLKEMLCAFPHNVTFCPAVFEGTEKQPDGTLSILIRLVTIQQPKQRQGEPSKARRMAWQASKPCFLAESM